MTVYKTWTWLNMVDIGAEFGEFPDEMRLLEELTYISVYRNPDIDSKFPEALRKIPKLEYLAMHFCDLEGTIPSWIGEMTSLTSLILSNNDLTGKCLSMLLSLD